MGIRHAILRTSLALGLAGTAPGAMAAGNDARKKAETLCTADAKRVCGDTLGDDAKTTQCMKSKRAELSPACRKASDALR